MADKAEKKPDAAAAPPAKDAGDKKEHGEGKKAAGGGKKSATPNGSKSADTKALEKRIEEALGLKASLSEGKGERTTLTLEIENYDQLDTVVERLTRR